MPDNPFVYGEIVPGAAFADRELEFDQLTRDLLASQKVFLISPRRFGKSSLIRRVLRHLGRRRLLTAELTVAASSSYVGFLEAYASALLTAGAPARRAQPWIADQLSRLTAKCRWTPAGTGAGSVSFPAVQSPRDIARLAAEVFALPGRIATARGRKLVVALDEFQAITSFDDGAIEEALRAAAQNQREVGYVFAGSEPSLMERLISPRRPFYKAGPVMRLDRIPTDAFAAFLETRFASTGIKPDHGLGAAIVDLAANIPYDVQRLAHETWDDLTQARRKTATLDDLHATLTRLLGQQQVVFEEAWQRLTLAQRSALRALVLEDGRELLSADVRTRHRLASPSSVQSALAALTREDVIMKEGQQYTMTDSLFREWVARTTF